MVYKFLIKELDFTASHISDNTNSSTLTSLHEIVSSLWRLISCDNT